MMMVGDDEAQWSTNWAGRDARIASTRIDKFDLDHSYRYQSRMVMLTRESSICRISGPRKAVGDLHPATKLTNVPFS